LFNQNAELLYPLAYVFHASCGLIISGLYKTLAIYPANPFRVTEL
jgi:hypothetical protein